MFDMVFNAIKLFFMGKLFRDNKFFFKQWAIGLGITIVLILGLSFLSPWLGMLVGGLAGGALMPWLYKDLKYH
jgi:hypothetical protein